MKKHPLTGRATKSAQPSRKAPRRAEPLFDEEMLSALIGDLMAKGKFAFPGAKQTSAVEVFADFLVRCRENKLDDSDGLIADLMMELQEARIDSNGGDPHAQKTLQDIDRSLQDALADNALSPPAMMMTGKVFVDAGLPPPGRLKEAMAHAWTLTAEAPLAGGAAEPGAALREQALKFGDNPFDIFDYVQSLTCILPNQAVISILGDLAKHPLTAQAVAGFSLVPDDAVAIAAAKTLEEAAKTAPVDSAALERLVLIRPWLKPARQKAIDEAIKAMRWNVLPAEPTTAKTLKCLASLCDCSGAMQVVVAQKVGTRYRVAAIMTKPVGVADAFILDDLPRREMDALLAQMRSAVPTAETNVATLARLLRYALGDNLASNISPPFRTAQAVEAMGLGPVYPERETPALLIERLLADTPPHKKDGAALAQAHAEITTHELADGWSESIADVESLLIPVKGVRQRIKKLLEFYLPSRRQFWARQCALTALVLRDCKDHDPSTCRQLALVGHDIASERPLTEIPLMTRIAEQTARAFASRH